MIRIMKRRVNVCFELAIKDYDRVLLFLEFSMLQINELR